MKLRSSRLGKSQRSFQLTACKRDEEKSEGVNKSRQDEGNEEKIGYEILHAFWCLFLFILAFECQCVDIPIDSRQFISWMQQIKQRLMKKKRGYC